MTLLINTVLCSASIDDDAGVDEVASIKFMINNFDFYAAAKAVHIISIFLLFFYFSACLYICQLWGDTRWGGKASKNGFIETPTPQDDDDAFILAAGFGERVSYIHKLARIHYLFTDTISS